MFTMFFFLRLGSVINCRNALSSYHLPEIPLPKYYLDKLIPIVFEAFYGDSDHFQIGLILPLAVLSCLSLGLHSAHDLGHTAVIVFPLACQQHWRVDRSSCVVATTPGNVLLSSISGVDSLSPMGGRVVSNDVDCVFWVGFRIKTSRGDKACQPAEHESGKLGSILSPTDIRRLALGFGYPQVVPGACKRAFSGPNEAYPPLHRRYL